MQQPFPVAVVTAGIHRHRPGSRVIGGADHHLHLDPRAGVHHQRRGQDQLVDDRTADLVAGADDQLHKTRPGEEHHPADDVIGQPWLIGQRQPARQYHSVGVGPLDHRTQQRVFGRAQTQTDRVGGPSPPGVSQNRRR